MQLIVVPLLVLVLFARLAELFPILLPLQLGKVGFALSGLALLMRRGGLAGWWRQPLVRPVLLLLMFAAASVPFSVWRSGALDSLMDYAKTVYVFCVLVILAGQRGTGLLRVSLLGSVLLLCGALLLGAGSGRAFVSSTYDPNNLALLFACFMPVLAAEGFARGGLPRLIAWGGSIALMVGIALTQSRGALIALLVVGGHLLLASRRHRLLSMALIVAGSVTFCYNVDGSFWDRFAILGDAQADYNVSDRSGRLELWKSGVEMAVTRPLFGVGVGQFSAANYLRGSGVHLTAHNTYVQIAAELGLIALAIYLKLLWQVSRTIERGLSLPESTKAARMRWYGMRYGLTAFAAGSLFVSEGYGAPLYCFLALAACMSLALQQVRQPVTGAVPAVAPSSASRRQPALRHRRGEAKA